MNDREKKIAELRKWIAGESKHKHVNAYECISFLLSELECTERENRVLSGMTAKLREENRKQFDRIVELTNCIKQITGDLTPAEFVTELIQNQDEFRRTMDELSREREESRKLREERDKLIEGLRKYLKEIDNRYTSAYQNYKNEADRHQEGMAEAYDIAEGCLRDILAEIGVTVHE